MDGDVREFTYYRSIAPMMWMLVLISGVELLVVHFLVSFWNTTAAFFLSAVTLAAIAWIVALIRSMKRLPVWIGNGHLAMGVGSIKRVETPLTNVADIREAWSAEDLKTRDVLNLALIAYPNVVIDLIEPLRGRRPIRAIAHRLDDAPAFVAMLRTAIGPGRGEARGETDFRR